VGLNQPLQTQHNEGVEGCNEGNPNAAIRRLGADRNEGEISNSKHLKEKGIYISSSSLHIILNSIRQIPVDETLQLYLQDNTKA